MLATKLKGILVVDEAYIDYATNADGKSPAGLAASFIPRLKAHPNVVVLRTFSKSYSMAGAVRIAHTSRHARARVAHTHTHTQLLKAAHRPSVAVVVAAAARHHLG